MPAKVLIIDDDSNFIECLKGSIESLNFKVEFATGGEEAKKLIEATSYSVIATDLVMPEIDGVELIRLIKRKTPSTKIIAFTGVHEDVYLTMARKLGADASLAKPFPIEKLTNVIEDFLK